MSDVMHLRKRGIDGLEEGDLEAVPYISSLFCTYRAAHQKLGLICLALATSAYALPITHYIQYRQFGQVFSDGLGTWDGLGFFSYFFLVWGSIFLLWGAWYLASSRNQGITVMNDTLTWTGASGRTKTRANFQEVVSLSLRQSWHKTSYLCEVRTTRGIIKWDSHISSATPLLNIAKNLAGQVEGIYGL